MDTILSRKRLDPQKKYRQSKATQGFARFELQVRTESKDKFEAMVDAAAEEYLKPWNLRQRRALARARIFDEIIEGSLHEFMTLKDQIESLKNEVKALSPSFFKDALSEKIPLPEAISSLPDDPQKLKALLARIFNEVQTAKSAANRSKELADQYEKLYEASSRYNEKLSKKLKEYEPSANDSFEESFYS